MEKDTKPQQANCSSAPDSRRHVIPRLRFPEFQHAGEWEEKKLGEVLDYERPDNYIVFDTNYQNEGTPVLTANKSFILGYTKEDFGVYTKIPAIIFDDFTVDSKYVDFPFKVKSSAIKILKSKGKDDLRFIYGLLSQIKFDAKDHKRYYISVFQNLNVHIPSLAEQQKIAACLSSLDAVIAAQRQKLEALQAHKKGLMQRLFPQAGERIPRLRFPEFQHAGEWVEREIGDVLTESRIPSVENNPNKRISVRLNLKGVEKREVRGTESEDATYFFIRKKGQFIYGKQNLHKGAFGIIPDELDGFESSQDLPAFDFNEKYYPKFFVYYLGQEYIYTELEKISTGTGSKRIHPKALFKVSFLFPSLAEQEKIAACLSSLDAVIAAQRELIVQLQQHKKGLMQGLFPSQL